MGTMKNKSVQDALQYVADHPPEGPPDPLVDRPAWELIGQVLFFIANTPDPKVRGSMGRATTAQKMIANRLTGRRRPGTHPAQVESDELEFADLTVGVIDADKVGATDAGSDENVQ
ncbi:hypothetical protein SEA_HANNABELLA_48 [Microbacterium phage Hannabella]|nr:hypothetical protein SEA_HANNABELLA_48 [Microbacterium phage Hannabella]